VLTRAHIQSFRSLVDVTVDLEPLTVLVGANGVGKSSLLRAIVSPELPNEPSFESGKATERALWYDGKGPFTGKARHRGQVLQLRLDQLRQETRVRRETGLAPDGRNFANVLYSIPRRDRARLAEEFCDVVPIFGDVDLQPTREGRHQIVFEDRWKENLWYPANDVSDGSLLMLAILTLKYQEERATVLGIEEPERGLHPYLWQMALRELRRFARDVDGNVLLATHSPGLVDLAKPEEVRFLSRDPETGATVVHASPAGTADWQSFFEVHEGRLGDAWMSGALGGVPGLPPEGDDEAAE
jgi:predicted ATPase